MTGIPRALYFPIQHCIWDFKKDASTESKLELQCFLYTPRQLMSLVRLLIARLLIYGGNSKEILVQIGGKIRRKNADALLEHRGLNQSS